MHWGVCDRESTTKHNCQTRMSVAALILSAEFTDRHRHTPQPEPKQPKHNEGYLDHRGRTGKLLTLLRRNAGHRKYRQGTRGVCDPPVLYLPDGMEALCTSSSLCSGQHKKLTVQTGWVVSETGINMKHQVTWVTAMVCTWQHPEKQEASTQRAWQCSNPDCTSHN